MGQYKVGDKIKVVKVREDIGEWLDQLGAKGVIVGCSGKGNWDYEIEFNPDNNECWCYSEDEIELIEEVQTSLSDVDKVNPPHYKKGKIECIDAIKAAVVGKSGFEGYMVGNIIKYVFRYEDKGGVEDLKKASWYINKLIDERTV